MIHHHIARPLWSASIDHKVSVGLYAGLLIPPTWPRSSSKSSKSADSNRLVPLLYVSEKSCLFKLADTGQASSQVRGNNHKSRTLRTQGATVLQRGSVF